MSDCCQKRLGSGGADEPRVVSNPNQTERALLRANSGHQAIYIEGFVDGDSGRVSESVVGSRKEGRRGKNKCWWTHEERKVLWECFVRSGRKRSGGYIKKMKELWDERGLSEREVPSLLSQLKCIEKGLLTVMERGEIEKKVRIETRNVSDVRQRQMMITREEWDALFGESDDEEEFHGFQGFEVERDVLDSQSEGDYDINSGAQKDSGEGMDREIKIVVEKLVTFRGNDGIRVASDEEKDVFEKMKMVFGKKEWVEVPGLKTQDRRKVNREVKIVDGLMHNLVKDRMSVSDINRLLYTGAYIVADRLGLMGKKKRKTVEMNKPWWQKRIESSIVDWRKDLARVEEMRKGTTLGRKVLDRLKRKYQVVEKGTVAVAALLKGKIQSGKTKIRWYVNNCTKVRQNNLFKNNQSQLYKELGGRARSGPTEAPNAGEATRFWSEIWSVEKKHNEDASWLGDVRDKMHGVEKQCEVKINIGDVETGIRKMANWKAPGPDGVRGFWFKRFSSLHGIITESLQGCLDSGQVPEWMVKGRTVLIQKDRAKGTVVSNYRPIACLPLMWKLLTGILAEKLYQHLQVNKLLQDEQKGCRKRSRGTKDQLLIDKAVLREARVKKRCLAMGWIDYRDRKSVV